MSQSIRVTRTAMKQKRIPISAPPQPFASPFEGLNLPDLPPGPEPAQPADSQRPDPGRIVLRREKARRGGKTVVVVSGFSEAHSIAQIEELARNARQHCGVGGTVHEREIELQGDQPERVRAFFSGAGYRVAGP